MSAPTAASTSPRTGPATCGPGGATRTPRWPRDARASSSARTSTPSPTAAPSTARSASSPPSPPSTPCAQRGHEPTVPLGVANFGDEEGARFGIACAGSRMLTGRCPPTAPSALHDADGVTMAHAIGRRRPRPAALGRDDETLAPGQHLRRAARRAGPRAGRPRPLRPSAGRAVGSDIWPHGRWRLDIPGRGQPRRHDAARRPPRRDARLCRTVLAARLARHATAASRRSARCASNPAASTRSRRRSPAGSTRAAPTRRPSVRRRGPRGRSPRDGTRAPMDRGVLDPDRPRFDARPRRPTSPASSARRTGPRHRRRPRRRASSRSTAYRPPCSSSATRRDLPLARGARRAGRLPRRRRRPVHRPRRPHRTRPRHGVRHDVTTYLAEHARLPPGRRPPSGSPSRTAGSPPSTARPAPAPRRRPPGRRRAARPGQHAQPRLPPGPARPHPWRATATSGPGASRCTPWRCACTPTPTSRWPGRLRRDGAGRHHRRRRVPLRAPRPGRRGPTPTRTRWAQALMRGRRRRRDPAHPARHLLPRRRPDR